MTAAADLLTELQARGVALVADGDRLRFHPRHKVTGNLLDRLREHKPELLGILARREAAPPTPQDAHGGAGPAPPHAPIRRPICRCGSTTWRDVPIHNGQSTRRDCGRCGRFISFPVWYGQPQPEESPRIDGCLEYRTLPLEQVADKTA